MKGSSKRAEANQGLEPVGSVLDEVIQSLRLEQRFAAVEATDHWVEAVPPEVLAKTRCVGVRDGELLVEVMGATRMGHLAVLKQDILERINRTLAEGKRLRAIRFVPMRTQEETKR